MFGKMSFTFIVNRASCLYMTSQMTSPLKTSKTGSEILKR